MINKKIKRKSSLLFCLIAAAVSFPLIFSGCGLPRKQALTIHYYTLSYDAPQITGIKKATVIRLKQPVALPPFNSRRIVYTTGGAYQQAFYHYHMWAADPANMIFNLLARDIRQSGIADAVVTGPSELVPTYSIEIVINRFYEKDEKKAWSAVLSLTARLIKVNPAGAAGLVFEKTYGQTKKLNRKNPISLARAMSLALSEISGRMIKDISMNLNNPSK